MRIGILCLCLTLLCGCGRTTAGIENFAARPSASSRATVTQGQTRYQKTGQDFQDVVDSGRDFEAANKTASTRAKTIADKVSEVEGVDVASAVITGNTAIVGLTLEQELDDKKLVELKRLVERTVKLTDGEVDHVAITTAPDLVKRITDLSGVHVADDEKEHLQNNWDDEIFFRVAPVF